MIKVLKIFIKNSLIILHIPLVFVFVILKKYFNIKIVYIECAAAGHFYHDSNIYKIDKHINKSKIIAVIEPKHKISNKYLYELVKKEFIEFRSAKYIYLASKLINVQLDDINSREKGSYINTGIGYYYKEFSIKMPDEDNQFCENWLSGFISSNLFFLAVFSLALFILIVYAICSSVKLLI